MGLFDQFPYTNFHELNLDWILQALKELEHTIDQFVAINALKYADPIQWNITSQYEKNTIVIDPQTGTAYISVQPVPSGVIITNDDYWSVVFDLGSFVTRAAQNFTSHWEPETTLTATFPSNVNDWLIWGDVLYTVISPIVAGDQYVVNSNIRHFTMEDIIGHLENLPTTDKSSIVNSIIDLHHYFDGKIGNLPDLLTIDKTDLVRAVNEVLTTLSNEIGTLSDLPTTDKTSIVNSIIDLHHYFDGKIGNLPDLLTIDKNNLVEALNEVLNDLTTTAGNLANLNTTDKSNLVNAINELEGVLTPADANLSLLMDSDYTKNKTIVIFGDSFGQAIPTATLEKYLPYATIYNACAGGTTVGKIVTDRDGIQTAYNSFRSAHPDVVPDIVLIFGFNNDAYAWAEDEDSIRDTIPFGSITTPSWTTTFGAVAEMISNWRNVNNNVKFGLIPYIALSDSGYFKIAKGAIDSGLMHFPHSEPVSILWLENFFDINHYDAIYWDNNQHPTTAQCNEIIAPILCKWLQNGMPNQKFPHGVYTIMTNGTGDDIVLKIKTAANELLARLSTGSSADMSNMPNGLYIVSVDTGLNSCPLGNITFAPWGGQGAYYVCSIENTPSNMYSAWLKPNSQSEVYVVSQLP